MAGDICFPNFTNSNSYSRCRTLPFRCILNLTRSTTLDEQFTKRRLTKNGQDNFRQEHCSKEKYVLRTETNLRLFAKEFGQGVRHQRVREKTKKRAGTLPLALSTLFPFEHMYNVVDMIVIMELQALQWTEDNMKHI